MLWISFKIPYSEDNYAKLTTVKIFKNVLNQENSTTSLIFLRVPNE